MSRFLTPSRIALLFLIKLYCGGYVPPEGHLPVLAFITSRLVPEVNQNVRRQQKPKENPISHYSLSLEDLKALLMPFTSTLRNRVGTFGLRKNLWEILELYLCSIKGVDTLLEDIAGLSKLMVPTGEDDYSLSEIDFLSNVSSDDGASPVTLGNNSGTEDTAAPGFPSELPQFDGAFPRTALTKGSLLGIYIAQAQIGLEQLRFEDAMKVWHNFELYRNPLVNNVENRSMLEDESIAEMNAKSGGRLYEIISHSIYDEERGENQISSVDLKKLLAYQLNQMQKFGARMPTEMKLQLESMTGLAGSRSQMSYYARFLDAWYQGDYTSSFENLHRYYDYAMQHTDRSHYQYALLNMAILHADFGSFSEAAAAMKETIATARENKDMSCLNYCLSWLYRFEAMHSGNSSESILHEVLQGAEEGGLGLLYLKSTARENGMHSIESQAMLYEAGQCLSKGHRPLEALERIYESSYLILHHQLNSMKASQTLTQCSLYARLGVTPLASSLCNVVLDCFAKIAPLEETIHARCRNSYMLAVVGKYELALEALYKSQDDATRNIKCEQYLAQCVGIIKLKRALHHCDFFLAESLIATLKSTPLQDQNLAFITSLSEIEYHMRLENFSDAYDLIESQFTKPAMDVYQRIRLMNAKVFLFAKVGRPQKGFSISLRAATAAYRSKNALALWESVVAVVGVLNALKEWDAAVDIAQGSIYQTIETEDAATIAQLRSVGADSLMGQAKELTEDKAKRQTAMEEALAWVDSACREYEQLEDYRGQCEMTVKAHAILKYFGDEKGAQERSKKLDEIEKLIDAAENA